MAPHENRLGRHTDICTIHDIGEQAGRSFIVMEYLVGVVLYEMAKGTRPAPGVQLRIEGTPELERIVSKCIDTDRELRYQHAAELRTDLERLRRGTDGTMAQHAAPPRRRAPWLSIGAAAVIAAAVAGAIPLIGEARTEHARLR